MGRFNKGRGNGTGQYLKDLLGQRKKKQGGARRLNPIQRRHLGSGCQVLMNGTK